MLQHGITLEDMKDPHLAVPEGLSNFFVHVEQVDELEQPFEVPLYDWYVTYKAKEIPKINDDPKLADPERETLLINEFKKLGWELEFVD